MGFGETDGGDAAEEEYSEPPPAPLDDFNHFLTWTGEANGAEKSEWME